MRFDARLVFYDAASAILIAFFIVAYSALKIILIAVSASPMLVQLSADVVIILVV